MQYIMLDRVKNMFFPFVFALCIIANYCRLYVKFTCVCVIA